MEALKPHPLVSVVVDITRSAVGLAENPPHYKGGGQSRPSEVLRVR